MLALIGPCQRSPQQLHEESENGTRSRYCLIMTSQNGMRAGPTSIAVAFRLPFLSNNTSIVWICSFVLMV